MSRKIARDSMKSAIEAVAKGIVKEIASIDFDTGCIMQAKRIYKIATPAEVRGEQRHQCMEGKGIWKD